MLIQKKAFEDLVKKEPRLLLTEVYMDQGKSGGSREKRAAFNQMIRHCHEGKIDLVITKSISRFGRNLADTAECIRELKGLGVPVYFEEEHLNTMDPSADLVIFQMAAEQNLYEELIYRLNDMERKEGSSFTWNKNKVYRI